ncbi:NAD-dependent malic enzyme [bioreactor metagenome]|uniref:NAD-dependent malic enzyme n=2 Tax=root TaxID=1 RepID=A0A645CAV6_9ZZZZ
MKLAAAEAISSIVKDEELTEEYIIPDPFNKNVVEVVSKKVGEIAIKTGIAKIK